MKKAGWMLLLVACALLFSSAVAESTEDAILNEITLASLFPWESGKAEATAYFESAGYVVLGISDGLDLLGTKTVNDTSIELFLLDEGGRYASVALSFDKKLGPYYLGKLVSRIFGPVSDLIPDTDAWNTGSNALLTSGLTEDGMLRLSWVAFEEELVNLIPFQQAEYPAKGLALAETAREAALGSASTGAPAAAPSTSTSASGFSFKGGITLGMTKAEVIAAEGAAPSEQNAGALAYLGTAVQGLPANLAYFFTNDALESIIYMLTETYSDEDRYIDDFDTLRTALTEKYGAPLLYDATTGQLDRSAIWTLRDVTISLHLQQKDSEIETALLYSAPWSDDTPTPADTNDI